MRANTLLKTAIRGVVLAGAGFATGSALAGYDLYNSDDTKITFNFDAVAATFANKDSWFGESKSFLGGNTNNWSEYGIEPKLSFESKLGGGTLFGAYSAVYTNTASDDASGLTIGNGANSMTNTEQANIGWKIADTFTGLQDSEFSISGGRQDYKIGSGMLILDGGSDGGDFGGWYLGMRKAFQDSGIARLKSKDMLIELFRISNRPRAGGVQGDATGANVEYTFFDGTDFGATKLGATYIDVNADLPGIDNLDVWDGRLDWTGAGALTGFGLSGEFAHEDNKQIESDGWFAQISYQFQVPWSPTLFYRYAHFDGDNPNTVKDEGFRSIAYGYTDYGSWYQGEISGNYPLGNGNLNSNMYRIKAQPSETLTLNVLYYDFWLDHPSALDSGVTSDDWGQELNLTADWAVTPAVYVIGVLGNLSPGKAAEQWTGGNKDWRYGMVYVSYSY